MNLSQFFFAANHSAARRNPSSFEEMPFSLHSTSQARSHELEYPHIGLPIFNLAPDPLPTALFRDIFDGGPDPRNRLNPIKIDTQNNASRAVGVGRGHVLFGDLQPAAWRRAEIDEHAGGRQKVVLFVQLDQLEGGTGPVARLFGQVVVPVQPALGVLLCAGHFDSAVFQVKFRLKTECPETARGREFGFKSRGPSSPRSGMPVQVGKSEAQVQSTANGD